jgi:hypothetical protein
MIVLKCNRKASQLLDDGSPDWLEITLAECIKKTEGYGFWKKGTVEQMLEDGITVHTPWALYKKG